MNRKILERILVTILFVSAQAVAVMTIIGVKYQKIFFTTQIVTGLFNIILLRRTFDYSQSHYGIIFLKLDKIVFIFEVYVAAAKTFDFNPNGIIGICVLLFGIFDFIRNCVVFALLRTFFTMDEYKNYRGVVELEKIILKSKFGYKEYKDQFVINYIKDNSNRYDPRVLFCLWTDDDRTRSMYMKEEALALVRQKIIEKEEDFQTDINAQAEARSKFDVIREEVSTPSEGNEQNENLYDEDVNAILATADLSKESLDKINAKVYEKDELSADLLYDFFHIDSEPQHGDKIGGSRFKTSALLKNHVKHNKDEPLTLDCANIYEVEKIQFLYKKAICEKVDGIYRVKIYTDDFMKMMQEDEITLEGNITKDSLKAYLTEDDAKLGLKLITQGFEKAISFDNFYDNCRQINNERNALLRVYNENRNIKSLINRVLTTFQLLVFLFILLGIATWKAHNKTIVFPAALFILPGMWYTMMPFLFLIYHKPFEIGDRIIINDDTLIVHELKLCYTRFERWNNDYVILNNDFLTGQTILNVKKSNFQLITLTTLISNTTTEKQIDAFRRAMKDFVKGTNCLQSVQTLCAELIDSNYYKLVVNIRHNINHNNPFFTWKTQNIFMKELVRLCLKHRISFDPMTITYEGQQNDEITDFQHYVEKECKPSKIKA